MHLSSQYLPPPATGNDPLRLTECCYQEPAGGCPDSVMYESLWP